MSDDRFPKDMDGPRNFAGRTAARTIADDSAFTWLRKRRFDSEARNKGGTLQVRSNAQALDGFYTIGDLVASAITVYGDIDARGPFLKRGPFVDSTGFTFNSSAILSRWDGWGNVNKSELLGFTTNKQGVGCPTYLITELKTYNGVKYTELYGYYFMVPLTRPGSGWSSFVGTVPASRYRIGSTRVRETVGHTGVVIDTDLNVTPYLIRDFGGDNQVLLFPPCVADQYPWTYDVQRVAPNTLFSRLLYLRSEMPAEYPSGTPVPNRVDNDACPGIEFRFSYDGGDSWFDASSTEFYDEFDTVLDLPGIDLETGSQNTTNNSRFNTQVAYSVTSVAPISATKAIMYGLVPYMAGSSNHAKIKLGIVDFAARTILSTLTLFDGTSEDALPYMGNQSCVSMEGGALFMVNNHAGGSSRFTNPPTPAWTPDGVNIVWQPQLPWPAYHVGFLRPFSPTECGMVVYVAGRGYTIVSTTDRGATWKERAFITAEGVPPSLLNDVPYLTNFFGFSQIREHGVGATPLPGAPWICDDSIPPPIL